MKRTRSSDEGAGAAAAAATTTTTSLPQRAPRLARTPAPTHSSPNWTRAYQPPNATAGGAGGKSKFIECELGGLYPNVIIHSRNAMGIAHTELTKVTSR